MGIIFYSLLGIYTIFYSTWFFYLAFMSIKEHEEVLRRELKLIWYGLYPLFALGLVLDVLFNWIPGSIYFREFPKELLFTSRCQRHLKGSGVQLARATKVCTYLLNPFDKGHC